MAVTKAEKQTQLEGLEAAFKAVETAILVDYRGLNVPQVTELRRQLRGVKARYKVVDTLAKRALKGTALSRSTSTSPGRRRSPIPVPILSRSRRRSPPLRRAHRRCRSKQRSCGAESVQAGEVAEDSRSLPAKPELYARVALPAECPDGAVRERAECRAARLPDGPVAGREEEGGSLATGPVRP